jgi:hypothetical protein
MTLFSPEPKRTATFSSDGSYRYTLGRNWDESLPILVWVLLNPSTADADIDDQTIRKCMEFARRWGYGGITVVNLFAYRSTNPDALYEVDEPIGAENDSTITAACRGRDVVCGWGTNGGLHQRAAHVLRLLRSIGVEPKCLHVNDDGSPKHPLYLAYLTPLRNLAVPA